MCYRGDGQDMTTDMEETAADEMDRDEEFESDFDQYLAEIRCGVSLYGPPTE